MQETSKDVTIGESRYQIGRMTARVGSWIAMQIGTKLFPIMFESQINIEGLPSGRSEMSETEFRNIQDHCLSVCRKYRVVGQSEVALPIMKSANVFAAPELEFDVVTISALTVHALVFNIAPFLQGDELKSVLASFKDIRLLNPSPLMDSSFGQ
jgi:hypothetical protein